MIPLFKSHYSIGKSILTLDSKNVRGPEGSDSIFEIAKEAGLSEVVLVEDSLTGFLQSKKACDELGLKLIFGLRMSFCNKVEEEDSETTNNNSVHKVIVFAKNSAGCTKLNELSTKSQLEGGGLLDFKMAEDLWDENSLKMCIPFYDSFIHKNACSFSNCIPDFSSIRPDFFVENNLLPLDPIINSRVTAYCKKNKLKTIMAKSIFYKSREDFDAYVTYKCICNRKKFMASLDKPGFDHLASREFSFESWKENNEA